MSQFGGLWDYLGKLQRVNCKRATYHIEAIKAVASQVHERFIKYKVQKKIMCTREETAINK